MRTPLCLILPVCLAYVLPGVALAQQPPDPTPPPSDPAQGFLSEVEEAVEMHDWLHVLDLAEPQYREARLKTGMTHAQFIAELLGLHLDGNTLQPAGQALTSEHLLRMRQIAWKRRGRPGESGAQSMLGTVSLSEGDELLIEVQFVRVGDNFRLTGARD